MSVIATNTGAENDEELALPKKVWESLREGGFEALNNGEDDEDMDNDGSDADDESGEASEEEGNASDSSVDDAKIRIDKMAADMEYNMKKQKDYQM